MFRILLAAILLFCAVIEAANTNKFITPPEAEKHLDIAGNPEYTLGDTVRLKWATDFKQANLIVRQLNATNGKAITSGSAYVKKNVKNETSLDWKVVSFNTDLTISNVFYFIFTDTSKNKSNQSDASRVTMQKHSQFVSHPFNITRKTTTSPSSGKENNSSNQNGLDYAARVGIGVGVGVGCTLLIALGVAIWYLRRRIKAIAPQSQAADDSSPAAATTEDDASKVLKPPASESEPTTHEKDTDRPPPAEMHGSELVEMPAERGIELPNQQQEVRYELP